MKPNLKSFAITGSLVASALCGLAQDPASGVRESNAVSPLENFPREAEFVFKASSYSKTHEIVIHLNPYYVQGDFNGDRKLDTAFFVRERKSGKIGIIVFHGGTNHLFQIAAGKNNWHIWSDENGGDNFNSINFWYVVRRGPVPRGDFEGPPPKLKGDAFILGEDGKGDFLVYWDGRQYAMYGQSD